MYCRAVQCSVTYYHATYCTAMYCCAVSCRLVWLSMEWTVQCAVRNSAVFVPLLSSFYSFFLISELSNSDFFFLFTLYHKYTTIITSATSWISCYNGQKYGFVKVNGSVVTFVFGVPFQSKIHPFKHSGKLKYVIILLWRRDCITFLC